MDSDVLKMVDGTFPKAEYRTGVKRCIQNAKYKLFYSAGIAQDCVVMIDNV